jgi:hypothetical protein
MECEMKKLTSSIVAIAMLLPALAQAATLEASGKVTVNRTAVSGTTSVKAGDSVSVAPGSSARVVYGPNCSEAIAPGTVGYVKGNSLKDGPSCGAGGVNPASAANPGAASAAAAGSGAAAGATAGALAIGAVALGAGALLALKKSKDLPAVVAASP